LEKVRLVGCFVTRLVGNSADLGRASENRAERIIE
jgi:hypothetical protein